MKRALVGTIGILALLLSCGGGRPSGVSNRAFVSNSFGGSTAPSGLVEIVNASRDTLSSSAISAGSQPGMMAVSPEREITLVFDAGTNQISIITNASEKTNASAIQLPDIAASLIAQSAATGYAAFRNVLPSINSPTFGEVAVLDLTNVDIANTISVPQAHRMVMNNEGTMLLVFSDHYTSPCGGTSSALTVIAISGGTATNSVLATVCGFDEAVWGVFSSDDSTAYIMNCGPECASSFNGAASVSVLNMASLAPPTSTVLLKDQNGNPNAGATVGLLNGSNLYVAGTTGGAPGAGTLTALNVSSGLPATASAPVPISDGYHSLMALASNDKVFVGSSTNCTNNGAAGCLSIFDASANTAVVDSARGFVTGMAPIANRNVVYVVEGGAFVIYDTTTSAVSTESPIDIVGTAVDVKTVDQ